GKTIPLPIWHCFVTGIRERHTLSLPTCCAVQGFLMNTFPIQFRNLASLCEAGEWLRFWQTFVERILILWCISRQLTAQLSRSPVTIVFSRWQEFGTSSGCRVLSIWNRKRKASRWYRLLLNLNC